MLANAVLALFGFIFWIIAARLYPAEAVGLASAIISAAGLLAMFAGLDLDYGLIRFLKSSNNPVNLINSCFTLIGLASLAVAGIYIIGLGIWSPGLNIIRENPYYLVIFILFVLVLVFTDLTNQVMMARRQAGFIFISALIFSILKLAMLVLLAAFHQSLEIFVSWSVAMLVTMLIAVFALLPRTQPGYRLFFMVDKTAVSGIMSFSLLNYLCDLFWGMPALLLPIMVINLLGAKSNAYFYMAWALSSVLTLIPAAVANSLLAEGAYDETKLKNHVSRSLKMIMVLLVPPIVLVWFLANKLLLFYGGQYAVNATALLRWLAITAFPLAINITYINIKRVQKKMKTVILLGVFMTAMVFLMSYLLLPRLGIKGIGIAWLAGQSVIAFIVIVMEMRRWV